MGGEEESSVQGPIQVCRAPASRFLGPRGCSEVLPPGSPDGGRGSGNWRHSEWSGAPLPGCGSVWPTSLSSLCPPANPSPTDLPASPPEPGRCPAESESACKLLNDEFHARRRCSS